MLEIQMISEESLSLVQGSLTTKTCLPVEQNKEPEKVETEETVAKDRGIFEGLGKGWQGVQVNV